MPQAPAPQGGAYAERYLIWRGDAGDPERDRARAADRRVSSFTPLAVHGALKNETRRGRGVNRHDDVDPVPALDRVREPRAKSGPRCRARSPHEAREYDERDHR